MIIFAFIGVLMLTRRLIAIIIDGRTEVNAVSTPYLFTPIARAQEEVWKPFRHFRPVFALLVKS